MWCLVALKWQFHSNCKMLACTGNLAHKERCVVVCAITLVKHTRAYPHSSVCELLNWVWCCVLPGLSRAEGNQCVTLLLRGNHSNFCRNFSGRGMTPKHIQYIWFWRVTTPETVKYKICNIMSVIHPTDIYNLTRQLSVFLCNCFLLVSWNSSCLKQSDKQDTGT